MKINVKDLDKVEAMLDKVQDGCKARLLAVGDISHAVAKAEREREKLGIPRKAMIGSRIFILPEAVPRSYQWQAEGTGARLEYFSTGWFLVSVYRGRSEQRPYGGASKIVLALSDTAMAAIPSSRRL